MQRRLRNAEMLPLTLSLLSTPFSRALPLPRSKYNIGTSFLTWSIAISSCHLSPLVSFPHRSHMIFSGHKSESYHSSCLKLFKGVSALRIFNNIIIKKMIKVSNLHRASYIASVNLHALCYNQSSLFVDSVFVNLSTC